MSNGIVERAFSCLGRGFDLTFDFRLRHCKGDRRLVRLSETEKKSLLVPGFGPVDDVPVDIKCDKGDRCRYQSDILEFNKVECVLLISSSISFKIIFGFLGQAVSDTLLGSYRCPSSSTRNRRCPERFHQGCSTPCSGSQAIRGLRTQATPSTWDSTAISSPCSVSISNGTRSASPMKCEMRFLLPGTPPLLQGTHETHPLLSCFNLLSANCISSPGHVCGYGIYRSRSRYCG